MIPIAAKIINPHTTISEIDKSESTNPM